MFSIELSDEIEDKADEIEDAKKDKTRVFGWDKGRDTSDCRWDRGQGVARQTTAAASGVCARETLQGYLAHEKQTPPLGPL